jgi:FkbH-like protein
MNTLFTELRWLPRAPGDFRRRLRSLRSTERTFASDLKALASHALDLNQLTQLGGIIATKRAGGDALEPLIPFRLAILSNSTVDLLIPALTASAVRHGVSLEIVPHAYDQIVQEALTPDSAINRSGADAVLFAIDYRALPLAGSVGDRTAAGSVVRGALGYLQSLRDGIKSQSNPVCIFQTFAPPVETLFGSLDRMVPATMRAMLTEINRELSTYVAGSNEVLLDVAAIAETIGLADWHDTQMWNLAKLPFAEHVIPLYAEHVARTVAAICGRSRKVLVLDLDNTVWGGVIGDDGVEGIKIAQGDAIGEAHLAVQRLALNLRERGVVLAVSSKNTDDVARRPFERHPEMLLRLQHIAVFQANWADKATNLRAIAEELSLGLDSLVFLDDNPVERGLIRSLLPDVAVPELPEEPSYYARTLAAAGYFESIAFTIEDSQRADSYRANAGRAQLQNQVGGVEAYLASLDMTITFAPFDATGRARIVQLINKSNQYNLTTHRYTAHEIMTVERDPDAFTLQVRLADRFGDNGMISVVICRPGGAASWQIDTWLMSCRVLGRRVETMVLREILRHAMSRGIEKLVGTYIPTEKNALVADHYAKLGFTRVAHEGSGLTRWELSVALASVPAAPMRAVSDGFERGLNSAPALCTD